MSGGSYNYLCFQEFFTRESDLLRMHDRLLQLGFRGAADETYRVLKALRDIDEDKRLRDAWQAVEWRDSADWGEEQTVEAIRELGWKQESVPS